MHNKLSRYKVIFFLNHALLFLFIHIGSQPIYASEGAEYKQPNIEGVAGEIVFLPLEKYSDNLPSVHFGLNEVAIFDKKKYWLALIGIRTNTISGEYLIHVTPNKKNIKPYTQLFKIKPSIPKWLPLREKKIPIKPITSFSNLNFSNTAEATLPLLYPTKTPWDDFFAYITSIEKSGKKISRQFINTYGELHTPITSPGDAVVSKIETLHSKNTPITEERFRIILDHGRGLFSILTGLQNITIKEGDSIRKGTILGMMAALTSKSKQKEPMFALQWQCVLNENFINPHTLTKIKP